MNQSIEMEFDSCKKHSVRYNCANKEDRKRLSNIYVGNECFESPSTPPGRIVVTITDEEV